MNRFYTAFLFLFFWAMALAPQLRADEDASCREKYQKLFSKPEIRISVAFSYFDARPDPTVQVLDQTTDFAKELLLSCENGEQVCGFARDSDDPNLFYKSVLGPDGEKHRVRLQMIVPTMGTDDDLLRKDPEQKRMSEQAREKFMEALGHDDVVIYQGHSRNGGGPDFFPPVLNSRKAPNYPWYERNHLGLNDLLSSLEAAEEKPKVFAMLSCISKEHFQKALLKAAPEMALLMTNVYVDPNDMASGRDHLINGLLSLNCDPGFLNGAQASWSTTLQSDNPKDVTTFSFEGWANSF